MKNGSNIMIYCKAKKKTYQMSASKCTLTLSHFAFNGKTFHRNITSESEKKEFTNTMCRLLC